jgi:hypothetical protein
MFPLGDCVLMVGSDLRRFQFDSAVANLLHSTMSLTSCLVNNLTRPQFKSFSSLYCIQTGSVQVSLLFSDSDADSIGRKRLNCVIYLEKFFALLWSFPNGCPYKYSWLVDICIRHLKCNLILSVFHIKINYEFIEEL